MSCFLSEEQLLGDIKSRDAEISWLKADVVRLENYGEALRADLDSANKIVEAARSWQDKEHRTLDKSEVAMRERWHREMVKVLDAILRGEGPTK